MKKTILLFSLFLLYSCHKKVDEETEIKSIIPATITTIDTSDIENYVDLNATATYLIKNTIKANATGYLNSVNVQSNDYVTKGKVLFTLQTRESKALGNTINKMDPSLHFGQAIKVKSESDGFITNVNVRPGDYVLDGDSLAIINNTNSFGLVLSLPYELRKYVIQGQELTAFLPDGTSIKATVQKSMPSVDMASQTQSIILKINQKNIPENLIVKVRIYKKSAAKSISLPKAAVLSDETESTFWIMKMINATTAVKIPIKKGITTTDRVEILAPVLTANDQILTSGNYGVSDTIQVKVIK